MTEQDKLADTVRRILNVETAIGAHGVRLTALEVKAAADEVHRTNVERRLTGIEETLRWLVRLIIGALILAAIGFAVQGGFSGGIK